MIRRMGLKDIPAVAAIWQSLFALTEMSKVADSDPDSVAVELHNLMIHPDAIVLVIEIEGKILGAACATCQNEWWDWHTKIGRERFWYLDPSLRGQGLSLELVRQLEQWAKGRGAVVMLMASLSNQPPFVGKLYEREGYIPQETFFLKRL